MIPVIYEDEYLLVVNKPPGIAVQADKTDAPTLAEAFPEWLITHRIDIPTSGLVLLAKNEELQAALNRQFAKHTIRKTYHAIVQGTPSPAQATLVHHLVHDTRNNKTRVVTPPEGKKSVLDYQILAQGDHYSLLQVALHTGRHHQIRAQLAAIGHPIKGDVKYQARRANTDRSICLHAYSMSLRHPVTTIPLRLQAPPPADALWSALTALIVPA
jgi:23S rRNA pseudouridine1911/1915/1917 synthase